MQALKKIMESHCNLSSVAFSTTVASAKVVAKEDVIASAAKQSPDVPLSLSKGELPNYNTTNESKAIPSPPTGGDAEGRGGIDFPWCLNFLEKRGKELYGQKFKIYEQDHSIIYKLIIYFIGNIPEAEKLGLDLEKGILLTGPVGCGKNYTNEPHALRAAT